MRTGRVCSCRDRYASISRAKELCPRVTVVKMTPPDCRTLFAELYAYSAYQSGGRVDRDTSSSSTSWQCCRPFRTVPASNLELVGLYVFPPDKPQVSSVSVRSILKRRFIRSFSLWCDTSEMASLSILPIEDGRVCGDSVLFMCKLC